MIRSYPGLRPWPMVFISLAMLSSCPLFAENARQDPALFNLTLGQVGIDRHLENPWRYGVEYRLRTLGDYQLIPSVGIAWVDSGASFLYSELKRDFPFANGFVLTPSFGLGLFNESTEFRLGQTLEFRSGIEIAYRFGGQYRFGLALFHMSNGGLARENPGAEALVLSFSLPM